MPPSLSLRLHPRFHQRTAATSPASTKDVGPFGICSSAFLRLPSSPLLWFSFLLLLYVFGLAFLPPFLSHREFFLHRFSKNHILSAASLETTEQGKYCRIDFRVENGSDGNILPKGSFCDYGEGDWVFDSSRKPFYSQDCPFQRNAWNCGRNKRPGMDDIFRWRWAPKRCNLPVINPYKFLTSIRNMKIGFIGDSLNENFLVSLLCILRTADKGAYKWKKKRAWRGAYFPKFNVTVGYHRAVLLAAYNELHPTSHEENPQLGSTRGVRVDVDIPANGWINVTDFYDIFVFNTGHWWGPDKFPPENPLIFYKEGKPLFPQLGLQDGLKLVLQNMIPYIETMTPARSLKIWRIQSPRHFEGGEWNQNGTCLRQKPLSDNQVEKWFDLGKRGLNREAREMNLIINNALQGRSFYILNITGMSEYRADAHPAVWLGGKDAHIIWGQDCMHWCLPGLPDIWVDILAAVILQYVDLPRTC